MGLAIEKSSTRPRAHAKRWLRVDSAARSTAAVLANSPPANLAAGRHPGLGLLYHPIRGQMDRTGMDLVFLVDPLGTGRSWLVPIESRTARPNLVEISTMKSPPPQWRRFTLGLVQDSRLEDIAITDTG